METTGPLTELWSVVQKNPYYGWVILVALVLALAAGARWLRDYRQTRMTLRITDVGPPRQISGSELAGTPNTAPITTPSVASIPNIPADNAPHGDMGNTAPMEVSASPPLPVQVTRPEPAQVAPDDIVLTTVQRKQLLAALESAFKADELIYLITTTMDENVRTIIHVGTVRSTVLEVVDWAERRGRLHELIEVARKDNPTNPKLRAFAASVGLGPT